MQVNCACLQKPMYLLDRLCERLLLKGADLTNIS